MNSCIKVCIAVVTTAVVIGGAVAIGLAVYFNWPTNLSTPTLTPGKTSVRVPTAPGATAGASTTRVPTAPTSPARESTTPVPTAPGSTAGESTTPVPTAPAPTTGTSTTRVPTAPASTAGTSTTRFPTAPASTTRPQQAILIGGFTIQGKTLGQVSNSSICSYLNTAVLSRGVTTDNCEILEKRQGSVIVGYRLTLAIGNANQSYVLKQASFEIALASSNSSVFFINQSSIIFQDQTGNISNSCNNGGICLGHNFVCISIVGGYACVCKTDFKVTPNGINCYNATLGPGTTYVYCKPTNITIPPAKICDNYQDCPDDSDEINCTCDYTYQYGCRNGRCIYRDWLCDGVKDCPQGDDEIYPQCSVCNATQFRCENPRTCIESSLQCDGTSDCADSSDERNCFRFRSTFPTNSLNVTFHGTPGYYICSENWNETWSDRICLRMGYGNSTSTSYVSVSRGSFLKLRPTSSSNIISSLQTSNCVAQSAVNISCAQLGCGTRSSSIVNVGPYIINGQRAARGAWPWQTIVYTGFYYGTSFYPYLICGGILINNRWILTAGHCTWISRDYLYDFWYSGTTRPGNLQIHLGTISRTDNPEITSRVDRVFTHPRYDEEAADNDVGLIRLSQPVTISDTVRPICLPAPDEDLKKLKVCVETGFGWTLRNALSNELLQARMNVMPDEECLAENEWYRNRTQICVGTTPTTGDINICSGDSGGPLSCQDANGVWKVIGVNSYGIGYSDGTAANKCRLSVVARVTAFVDWIKATIANNTV